MIVGRNANTILKNFEDSLHVFDMLGSLLAHGTYEGKMPDMTEAKISEEMHTIDRARKKFCSYYTNTEFGVADYYDICLNASALGIDNCIDVLYQLCK